MDLDPLKIDRSEKRRRRRGRGGVVRSLVLLALVVATVWTFRAPIMGLVDRLRLPEVAVVRVVERSPAAAGAVSGAAMANGYIVARTRAALSADTPGRIVELNVEEGSVVQAGDVVARLYSEEYAAALARAEAEFALGLKTVDRTEAQLVSSQSDIERRRSVLESTRARRDEAQAARDLAKLRFDRMERLVAEGVEREQDLDEARAELDSTEASVAAAIADIDAAHAVVEEGEALIEVARLSLEEAEGNLDVLAAARDQAQATLKKTEVTAPFDGIVVLKDAEVGEVVSPNSQGASSRGSVVTMVDFASLEVQAEVPETSLSVVELGAGARIYLDARPGKPYPGRVDRIWPTADRQKATVEVRIVFDERDEFLRPEMGVRVVFLEEGAEVPEAESEGVLEIVVPTAAVVRVDGADGVFVLERDVARFRAVELGRERSGKRVVLAGLEPGEDVVLEPPLTLEDGDRVRVL